MSCYLRSKWHFIRYMAQRRKTPVFLLDKVPPLELEHLVMIYSSLNKSDVLPRTDLFMQTKGGS